MEESRYVNELCHWFLRENADNFREIIRVLQYYNGFFSI